MGTLIQLEGATVAYREAPVRKGAVINLPSLHVAMNSSAIAFSLSVLAVSRDQGAFLVQSGDLMSISTMDSLTSPRALYLALKTHLLFQDQRILTQ